MSTHARTVGERRRPAPCTGNGGSERYPNGTGHSRIQSLNTARESEIREGGRRPKDRDGRVARVNHDHVLDSAASTDDLRSEEIPLLVTVSASTPSTPVPLSVTVALAWLFVLLEMEREPARAPDCVGKNET